MSTTLGLEPLSIAHYTRPGSSIKRPTQNYLAAQRHVNWPVVYPVSSYKIMDPVSAALHQNLRRFFVATLILTLMTVMFAEPSPGSWPQHRPAPSLSRSARSHPSNSPTTDRLELLPIKVKSILKSEPNPPSYTKNYNGGNCLEHLFTLSLKYFNL